MLGLQISIGITGGGSNLDASAAAYFAALPNAETPAAYAAINAFILGMKADQLWNLFDSISLMSLGTLANSLIDMKLPSRVATRYAVPTSTFTAYGGFTGSGSADIVNNPDAINTGYNPSVAGINFVQDSASLHTYLAIDGQSANLDSGINGPTIDFTLAARSLTDTTVIRSNCAAHTIASGVTVGTGLFSICRVGATSTIAYRNGSQIGTSVVASIGNADSTLNYVQVPGFAGSTHRIPYGAASAGLNATQAAAHSARVLTLLTALGAN